MDDSTSSRTCPVSIESTSLLDEKILADPWEFYAQLHAECPVYKMPETGIYVVTKHERCRQYNEGYRDVFKCNFSDGSITGG